MTSSNDGVVVLLMCPDGTGEGKHDLSAVQNILLQGRPLGLHVPGDWPVCKARSSWSWPSLPVGLEDVSKYPDLIAELLRRNWTETEVRGLLAENLLRVFSAVELVRRKWPSGFPILPPTKEQAA